MQVIHHRLSSDSPENELEFVQAVYWLLVTHFVIFPVLLRHFLEVFLFFVVSKQNIIRKKVLELLFSSRCGLLKDFFESFDIDNMRNEVNRSHASQQVPCSDSLVAIQHISPRHCFLLKLHIRFVPPHQHRFESIHAFDVNLNRLVTQQLFSLLVVRYILFYQYFSEELVDCIFLVFV